MCICVSNFKRDALIYVGTIKDCNCEVSRLYRS